MLANNKVLRGRYRIIRPLGQGAAGTVYEAYDSERETNVALKEILIDLEKVSNISQREKIKHDFANQAKILAKVKHESLPQVRGYFAEVDRHYLIMELVDGVDVGETAAQSESANSFAEITNWADQLLDTLDYLHTFAPAIVHQDINPANIKLTSRGKIKLLGFNIANAAETEASVRVKNQSAVTIVNYRSLEQIIRVADQSARKKLTDGDGERMKRILKQPIDAQSDIYALGASIYHLLTGQTPADALERTLEIWAGKSDPLSTAHQVNPDIPAEISDVLTKSMEIERENRFESAAQMRQELQTAVKKVQERTTEETKKQEVAAAREAFLAEEKRLEQERQVVEEERRRIEAERKQQAELIERQLKEAETQRIQAEKRAAEAEKRLSENQNQKASEKSPAVAAVPADSTERGDVYPKSTKTTPVFDNSTSLFAEPVTNNKSSKMIPLAALAFLMVAGLAAGVWFMRPSNAAESQLPSANPTAVMADRALPENSAATPPPVEKSIETTTTLPKSSSAPDPVVIPVSQSAPKTKSAAPPAAAPKIVKPSAPATAKPAANQKKAVTVDDIIGN